VANGQPVVWVKGIHKTVDFLLLLAISLSDMNGTSLHTVVDGLRNGTRWIAIVSVLCVWAACSSDNSDDRIPNGDSNDDTILISDDFESGSIGQVVQQDHGSWDLHLKDDNNNSDLPDRYRNWWYVRLDSINPGQQVVLTLHNRGWTYYYVPVYSYDQSTWHRFDEDEVQNSSDCEEGLDQCTLQISTRRFTESRVYVARFYPYTTRDQDRYMAAIQDSPYVTLSSLGQSSEYGLDIPFIRIEDPDVADSEKRAVWMHARSHPAETGSSFLLEGAIDQLLHDLDSDLAEARGLVYYIAPMHNVDGVVEGNYRTDSSSRNLEVQWRPDVAQTLYISEDSALENRLLNAKMVEIMSNVSYLDDLIALNLHSSNSSPNTPAFAYPHFGDDPDVYSPQEISLWRKQLRLIALLSGHYGGRFSPPPEEGGSGFFNYPLPETWWWENMSDGGVAMTIETVYSKAGFNHWVTPDDIRDLGAGLTRAIYDYYADDTIRSRDDRRLKVRPDERVVLPDEIDNKL